MPSNSARYTKSVEQHYESGKNEDAKIPVTPSFMLGTHQTVCVSVSVYCLMSA